MKRLLAVCLAITACGLLGRSAPAAAAPTVAWPATSEAEDSVIKAIPAAPSNLQATSVTINQLTLTWTLNSSDATVIHIEGKTSTTAFMELPPGVSGNSTGAIITNLQPGTTYTFRVRASNSDGFSAYSNQVSATTGAAPTCTTTATAGCLFGGRFQVTATWTTGSGATGSAEVSELTDDSAYLWFFAATNPEVLLKVIDACTLNNKFWFFAGGLTNVRVMIHVTDTQNGAMKTYTNQLNTVFQPIQDTSAFACP